MARIQLTIDKVTIDPEAFSERHFQDVCEDEISNTIANTIDKLGRGQNVDGLFAKKGGYKPSYKKAIEKGSVPGKTSTVTNLRQRGELLESYQPVRIQGGCEGRFIGGHRSGLSSAKLFEVQQGNGYNNIAAFGPDDEKRIEKRIEVEAGKAADQMIKVQKGR